METRLEFVTIMVLMDEWEKKLVGAGVIDNSRCQGLWLKLYGDGSGSVVAEWSAVKPSDDRSRSLVRTVMTMAPSSIFDFDTLDELHGGLVAQQMKVKRSGGDGEPGEEYWE